MCIGFQLLMMLYVVLRLLLYHTLSGRPGGYPDDDFRKKKKKKKGHNTQHSSRTGPFFQTETIIGIQLVRPTEYVIKYKVREIANSLLNHHCYCPMLLMRTTKTAVCLHKMANFVF